MNVLVNVANQKLKIATNFKSLIAGTQKFIRFVFNVTGEWDGLTMFAQFEQDGKAHREYLDSNNSVFLPPGIKAGTCTLMLYGSNADNVIGTTNYVTLTIDENNLIADSESTEIAPSLYNQLMEKLQQPIDMINTLIPLLEPNRVYQAEEASFYNTNKVNSPNGNTVSVGGVGNGGWINFEVEVDFSGVHTLDIYYITLVDRDVRVTTNGREYLVNCVGNGQDWDTTVLKVSVDVTLVAGTNYILLDNPDGYAPNLDRIEIVGKGLIITEEHKRKLNTVEEGATRTIVDATLSSTSTNPVQNKVVEEALNTKANSPFYVTAIEGATDGYGNCTANKSLAEIIEAYQAGRLLFCKLIIKNQHYPLILPLTYTDERYTFDFSANRENVSYFVQITNDGGSTEYTYFQTISLARSDHMHTITGIATGVTVVLDDVSSTRHTVMVEIPHSKNYFDREAFAAALDAAEAAGVENVEFPIMLEPNSTYTWSDNKSTAWGQYSEKLSLYDDKGHLYGNSIIPDSDHTLTFETFDGISYHLECTVDHGRLILEQTSEIQIEKGVVATAYEPYGDFGTITYALENGVERTATPNTDGVAYINNARLNITIKSNSGLVMKVKYLRDANTVIEKLEKAIIALGGIV